MRRLLLVLCILPLVSLAKPAPKTEGAALKAQRQRVVSAIETLPEGALEQRKSLDRQRQIIDELLAIVQEPQPLSEAALKKAREAVTDELNTLDGLSPPEAPKDPTEAGLMQLETEVEAARVAVETLQAEVRQRELRLSDLPGLIAAGSTALSEARGRVSGVKPNGPDAKSDGGTAVLAELEFRLEQARLTQLQGELENLRLSGPLHADQLRLARRKLTRGERALKAYQDTLEREIKGDRVGLKEAFELANTSLQDAKSPEDLFIARWRVETARAALAHSQLSGDRLDLQKLITQQRDRLVVERDEVSGLRLQIQRGGEDAPSADRLKELYRRGDRRHRELRDALRAPSLTGTGERRSRRYDAADRVYNFDSNWDAELAKVESEDPEFRKRAATLHDQAFAAARKELRALEEIVGATGSARSLLSERQTLLEELDRLVRSRIFWVQDAPALYNGGLKGIRRETNRLNDTIQRIIADGVEMQPAAWIALLIIIAAGFGRRRLLRLANSWDATIKTDFLRAFARGLAPLGMFLIARLAETATLPDVLQQLVVAMCNGLAWLSLAWWLLELLFSTRGLGVRHLAVPPEIAQRVNRAGFVLLAVAAVLLLPAHVLATRPLALAVIPRLAETVVSLITVIVVAGLFRPGRSVLRPVLSAIGGDHAMRFGRLIGTFIVVAGLALFIMDVAGYRYGADWIGANGVRTFLLLLPVWLIFPGIVQLIARRYDPDEASVRRWVLVVFLLFTLGALAVIWEIDRRAVAGLDGVEVFRLTGEGSRGVVTLLDLAKFVFTWLVTFALLRIIPGLLRVLVYPYIRTDAGGRYAILTILRYGVFLVGALVALYTVHLDLGRLSWLMAAVGVGLGFGLQEIVANFVSGLIILLERPIKVGDFVTIGSVEGEITQINIRATTVMNLDRQELIVPNRDFITKEVTNWTRADTVVRLAIFIGVAYGTEVQRVIDVLVEVAKENDEVLKQPTPSVQMLGHGDSSLDFRLLVFHADPRRASSLRGLLNHAVNKALVEHSIEIPFPQRDLHLRSSDVELIAKANATQAEPDSDAAPLKSKAPDTEPTESA